MKCVECDKVCDNSNCCFDVECEGDHGIFCDDCYDEHCTTYHYEPGDSD